MRQNRILFNLYQVYKYIVVLPLFGLSTIVLVTIGLIVLFVADDKTASKIAVVWARFNSIITPMFVEVVGLEKIDRKQSYIFVANHQSLYDILVVYGWMPVDFKWVMKVELRKAPFIGYFCRKIGHIFVDRSNPEAAKASVNAAKNKIVNGTSIMFFPEGTWNNDGKLLNFKKGAFRFALDLQLPVLPVTIINTRNILPGDSFGLFPGFAKLIIHDPIKTEDYEKGTIGDLIVRAKNTIQKGLDEFSQPTV